MNEVSIIFEDLKNSTENEMQSLFSKMIEKIKTGNKKNSILLDLEDFFISNSFKRNLTTFLNSNSDFIHNVAVYGVGKGVRKVILQSIDFPIFIADDREDALDWLQSL